MKIEIINHQGEKTGRTADLPKEVFGIKSNKHVVYLAVKHYQANQRQGTAKTKERGEIRGSTVKLYKQKGTGNARRGSIKSPILRGGGTVFGPSPRDYNSKLNKKTRLLAYKSVLSDKAYQKKIAVIENFSLDTHKTKGYVEILQALDLQGKKTLLVLSSVDRNLMLAASNLPKARIITHDQLNVYNMMDAQEIIFFEESLPMVIKKFDLS